MADLFESEMSNINFLFSSVIEEMDTTCQRTPQKRRGAISAEVYTEEEVSLFA